MNQTIEYPDTIPLTPFAHGVIEAYEEAYGRFKVVPISFQRMYELGAKKKRERLRRRGSKGLYQILGTGDKTTYLTTLPNGRIYGAALLEKQMKNWTGEKLGISALFVQVKMRC